MRLNSRNILVLILCMVSVGTVFFIWKKNTLPADFGCWARVQTKTTINANYKSSFAEVYLSMQKNGRGYFLINGDWSVNGSELHLSDDIANFNYKKEGDYFSIHIDETKSDLSQVFNALKYSNLKIKITRLESADYLLTLPNDILMICTES